MLAMLLATMPLTPVTKIHEPTGILGSEYMMEDLRIGNPENEFEV